MLDARSHRGVQTTNQPTMNPIPIDTPIYTRICAWPKCGRSFKTTVHNKTHCSYRCTERHKQYRMRHRSASTLNTLGSIQPDDEVATAMSRIAQAAQADMPDTTDPLALFASLDSKPSDSREGIETPTVHIIQEQDISEYGKKQLKDKVLRGYKLLPEQQAQYDAMIAEEEAEKERTLL